MRSSQWSYVSLPFAIRCLSNRHHQTAGRQGDWTTECYSTVVANGLDLAGDFINVSVVFTGQLDDGHGSHSISSQRPSFGEQCSLLLDLDANTSSDGLTHVADGKAGQFGERVHLLNGHWLGWLETDETCVSVFKKEVGFLSRLVRLLEKFHELHSDLRSVSVEHRGVSNGDSLGDVHELDLTDEGLVVANEGWFVVGVSSNVTATNVNSGEATDVESDVVTWFGFVDHGVVHLNRLDFTALHGRVEHDVLADVEDTGLDFTDRHSTDTGDLVDVLNGQAERLVGRLVWHGRGVDGLEEGWSIVPWALVGLVEHVVAVEGRGRDHGDVVGLESSHLQEARDFLDSLVVLFLVPINTADVHFVDVDDESLDSQHLGQEGVLLGLGVDTVVGCTEQHSGVGLGSTGDHVLDEVTVTRSIDDGPVVVWGEELLVSDVDGDTTFALP